MELTEKKISEFEDDQQKLSNRDWVAEKEKNEEQIFEEIIAKVSQIWQDINLQVHEPQQAPSRVSTKENHT